MRRHRTGRGDWLHEAHREHGARILAEGWSQRQTALALDMSERKARRLWEYTHDTAAPRRPQRIESTAGPRTHLVIPDTHAKAHQDLERFTWLGRLIEDIAPDVVVHLGDHYDLASVSTFDRGTVAAEGQRYADDIDAGNAALEMVHAAAGGALDSAERWWCIGNHEDRIERYAAEHPELVGAIGLCDMDFERRGWTARPHMLAAVVDGICYSHSHPSGLMGRPISGENMAASLIKKGYESCVAGHSHTFDVAVRTTRSGRKLLGLAAGCYLDPADPPKYAKATSPMWWSGVVVLRGVVDGFGSMETIDYSQIRSRYGR